MKGPKCALVLNTVALRQFGGAFFVGNNSHSRIHASALMFNSAKVRGQSVFFTTRIIH